MPSLRQSARGQRASRTSSPFVRTANTSPAPTVEPKKERAQSSLDAWIEPPLRSPVPSFQDHGMERTALFQDMAPLGAMPPTRLKLKVKGDFKTDKSDSLPASDVATGTPEGTPPVETKSSEPPSQEPAKEEQKSAAVEVAKAKEEPADDSGANGQVAVTPQIRSPAVQNGTTTPAHSRHTSLSKITHPSPQRTPQMAARVPRDAKMEKVIKKAIDIAKESGQDKLATVITKFYEETYTNAALAVLFDAVITKNETDAQKKQFQEEMKRIRKAVKRESRESSRSRTMSGSAPPVGYSGQSSTISTMGHSTIGQQPLGFYPSHISQRPGYSPQSAQQSPSLFNTFRAGLQPSPFSPTQSHPGSPTFPIAPPSLARPGITSPQAQQNTPAPASQSITATQSQAPSQTNATPQQSAPIMVSTRRSAARAAANLDSTTPAANAGAHSTAPAQTKATKTNDSTASETDLVPVTNGSKKGASDGEVVPVSKSSTKLATKSPRSGKGRRTRRSPSADSVSSLSSVDENVVEKGNPSAPTAAAAAAAAESQQPSRAVSRSATPRPGVSLKVKIKKGSNLKNLAGTKRGASETIAIEEADDETRERRNKAKANYDRELRDRKAEEPPEPEFTSYRESEDYLDAVPETIDTRSRRVTRRQSAPDTSRSAITTRNSTAAQTPAPPIITGRRARDSTQSQRLQLDVVSTAPRLEVTTPSTPGPQPLSDAESNGDPPPKRRKTARTKYSPVKLPNGVAPSHRASPSRSSPLFESGREGKKQNRDQCFSCGCGGNLICCDMCQNSFHAECWDPPCADASDEPFQGFEWICTHCRIYDKKKENEERAKKGEPLLIDTSDEESDLEELDDDVPTTPTDWTLVDAMPVGVPLFKQLSKGFKELLPEQFGLKPVVRDAYDGYVADSERRYRPTQKPPITVDSRMRPTEAIFDEGKHIKDPKDVKHCVQCGLTAVSKKGDLIKCDECGLFWHIDCLPNPTTAPPQTWSAVEKRGNRMTDVFKKRYWECPRHVDQDMILLTNPNSYAGDINIKRGIRARLPKKQVNQVAALKAGLPQPQASNIKQVRDAPDDVMYVNIEVDDSWWEKYDTRKNEMKETDNNTFSLHENNVLADFAAKARNNRVVLSQTNDELIDGLVPNTYERDQLKKQWREQQRAEIQDRVQMEVEATMTLAGLRQQARGIDINDLLAEPTDDSAVDRLVGFMTQYQIKQMHTLLDAVSKKIGERPDRAVAQRGSELDDSMDAILASGADKQTDAAVDEEDDGEEPAAKRRKTEEEAAVQQ